MERTQIYLDEAQSRRLAQRARALGVTKSSLIRQAIDAFLGSEDRDAPLRRFREALAEAAGTVSRLPSGKDYVAALRQADAKRQRTVEERTRR